MLHPLHTHTQVCSDLKAWLLQIQAMAETVPEGKGTDKEKLQHSKRACIMQRGDSSLGFLAGSHLDTKALQEQQSLQHPGQACAQYHIATSPSGIRDVGKCICHVHSKEYTVKTTPEPPARAADRESCQWTQKHRSLVKSLDPKCCFYVGKILKQLHRNIPFHLLSTTQMLESIRLCPRLPENPLTLGPCSTSGCSGCCGEFLPVT